MTGCEYLLVVLNFVQTMALAIMADRSRRVRRMTREDRRTDADTR